MKKINWLKIVFFLFLLLFLLSLFLNFFSFNGEKLFGYLDYQLYWQNLQDLASGKVIYRDFFWEYGFLYLAVGLPFFLFLGKTFFSSLLVRFLVLPLLAFLISFFLGKELLKKVYLLLFLFLLFLFGVNVDYTSFRHLLPELGLIFIFLGFEKKQQKKFLFGSFLLGLSLTSSLEYGLAALISLIFYFLLIFFRKQKVLVIRQTGISLAIIFLTAFPYFLYLYFHQALKNLFLFTWQYAQSFYFLSPCRELFPRLNEVSFSLSFLQRINLYLVPLLLFILLGITFWQRKAWWSSLILSLLIYCFLVFYRVLMTPCFGYLTYGLTFLFLVLVFFLALPKKTTLFKIFLLFCLGWFFFVGIGIFINQSFFQITGIKEENRLEKKALPVAGIKLEKNLVEEYEKVVSYIQTNSQKEDYLYVYPNGPYNQLSQRPSPVSVASTWYLDLTPFLLKPTVQQLEAKKPKLVVLNIYNAWNIRNALYQINFNFHQQKEAIIFEGVTTPLEDFLAQNYQLAQKFKIAWVLERKSQLGKIQKYYQPLEKESFWETSFQGLTQLPYLTSDKSFCFQVNQTPMIQFDLKEFSEGYKLVKIPVKVDLGLNKVFSKFILNLYAITDQGQSFLLNRQLVSNDWQDFWAQLPLEKLGPLQSLTLTLTSNQGFFWWGKPNSICFKEPELFIVNPNLQIEASAFED